MRISAIITGVLWAMQSFAFAQDVEIPATPIRRTPPAYPAACQPPAGADPVKETVIVVYTVNEKGVVEDARVRESSNPCFDETALAAARGWRFEPRRVDGRARPQEDVETALTFFFNEETATQDFDARPIKREPPNYPSNCYTRADQRETVLVSFDVTEAGGTDNIRVIEATSYCFEDAAKSAVKKWRYQPKTVDGETVRRNGVETIITFVQADKRDADTEVRESLDRQLARIERGVRNKEDYKELALEDLAALEQKYGDDFSKAELGMFHHVRALARIKVHDFAGALDDLRVVQSNSPLTTEGRDSVNELVIKLEAVVAAEEARSQQ